MSAVVVGFAGMTHLGIVAAVAAAERGFVVRGYDADERMAERLNRHDLPILDPDLGQLLAKKRDRICFTATARDLASCDVSISRPTRLSMTRGRPTLPRSGG